ncbi:MAG: S-layer homology domain-containing protein [Oscillospiraceae bacterium]|nr:S-layer homology domain-containing protein [Oscillospiraceae bacterium]
MKTTSKKTLSALLAIAIVFSLMTAIPGTTARAVMTAEELMMHIINFDPGNGGAMTGQFSASVDGSTVTVTGTVADAKNMLRLNLDNGVTVIWSASFSGSNCIDLEGQGTLEIPSGGLIENSSIYGNAIDARDTNTVKVTGGTVRANNGHAISGGNVEVTGGRVEMECEDGVDYNAICSSNTINISGGIVVSAMGAAIYGYSGNSHITISNGVVRGVMYAINSYGTGSTVTITGGLLESSGIYTATVDASNITMSGGIIRNTGIGHGIYNTHEMEITGGTISAKSGCAVFCNGTQLRMTGGFIFAYGVNEISSHGAVQSNINTNFFVSPDSDAIICEWNYSPSKDEYTAGTSTDLTVYPEDATVQWDIEESFMRPSFIVPGLPFGAVSSSSFVRPSTFKTYGIRYSYKGNEGFFEIEGIKVIEEEVIAEHTVTFNSNGGSAVASQTVATGDKVTKPADPTRSGYTFAGWFSNSALSTAYNFDTAVTANITLYAKWEASTSGGTSPAETGSMENFLQSRTYTPGMFNDINEDAWYGYNKEKAVANAYDYGLMSGYPDNTFRPTGNITVAEAITVAARVHRIYTTGTDDFVQGTPWFQVYIDYAISNGIISSTDFATFNQLATRREMAYIFANALPKSEFTKQNTVNSLPDVNNATPYSQSIIMLYEAGIIGGSDTAGTFNPGNNITRAEAAAIISRVILPSERFSGRTYG